MLGEKWEVLLGGSVPRLVLLGQNADHLRRIEAPLRQHQDSDGLESVLVSSSRLERWSVGVTLAVNYKPS